MLFRLLKYLRTQKRVVAILLVLLAAGSFVRVVPPLLTKIAIDEGIANEQIDVLGWAVLGFLIAVLLTNGLMAGRLYAARLSAQRVIHDIRNDVYLHLGSKSMSFFDSNQTGDLMSRLINDINTIQMFFMMAGNVVLSAIAMFAFNFVFMFALDWQMASILLVAIPLVFMLQRLAAGIVPLFRASNVQMGRINVEIREAVAGAKVVQAFRREEYQEQRFDRENWKLRDLRMRMVRKMATYTQGIELVAGLLTVMVLGVGGAKVIAGDMTFGALVAFQSYLLLILAPTRFLGFAIQIGQQAVTAGERVFQIVDTPLEVAEAPDAVAPERIAGRLQFEAVSFQYGASPPILRDITFDVPAGSSLAVVGRSGSGKSTIVNLVPRFYDPTSGRISVDGIDLRKLALRSLRSNIGMVMQETFLFNLSVRDNIRFGRPEATDADVEAAARAASAHEFIEDMPAGYDTIIGDRGVKLSGGQRQRIAIARALLVQPRILILDEATSSVDTRTDRTIREALDVLMQGRTTVIIAHRLSTVQRADQILVLADGAVAARGTHDQLLAQSDEYRAIYDLQFRLQEEGMRAAVAGREGAT